MRIVDRAQRVAVLPIAIVLLLAAAMLPGPQMPPKSVR